ncbi:MAG: DUF305 domain-containing protein [Armatimonadota bacterium]|nr:DUF305 domain-containing protein [Armatimonadota bacterium]
MARIRFVISVLIAAVTAMLAHSAGAGPSPVPPPTPHPTVAALSRLNGPAFDAAFMRELIPVHEEAIEIAMAATLNADHPELLRWNQVMIDRKSAQVRQMLAWLQEAGASPGKRNANVVTDPVKKMRGLSGASLERAYLPLIAAHLDHSVALAKVAATRANRQELRALAQTVVAVEGREAAMLRDWLRKWYPK